MKRILIVDDKDDNVYYLKTLYGATGYQVDTAMDGEQALARARATPPDLVITDLLMPNMDGYVLLQHWKSDRTLRNIPVVVYTATYTTTEDETLARDFGADEFLVKPAEPQVLLDMAARVLSNPRRNEPAQVDAGFNPDLLTRYNSALVRKLESKMAQLESANKAVRAEQMQTLAQMNLRSAILDSLPANIALLDGNGTILAVNEAWKRLARENGASQAHQTVGANYIEICKTSLARGDMSVAPVIDGLQGVLSGQTSSYSLEYPCDTEHGRLWYRMTVSPIADEDRGGAVVVHVDVTETKRAEARRRREAARLALAVESAGIGIWEWAPGQDTYFWNDRQYDIHGLPQGQPVTYEVWADMMPVEDRETPEVEFAAVKAAGGRRERTYRLVRPDGGVRFIQEVERIIRPADEGSEFLLGTNLDITELRVHQTEIQGLNRRLGLLVSQAPIGILVHRNFDPVLVNDELCKLFGCTDHDELALQNDFLGFFDASNQVLLREQMEAVEQDEAGKSFLRLRAKRKDKRMVELEARSFRLDWGDMPAICTMLMDVTEQRKLEVQLRQSQRLEAVGTMTGGVAHDFNNLLTIVLGNAELLQDALHADPRLRSLAEMIVQAAERGAHLSSQLLAFSRRRELTPDSVNANHLLRNLEGLLRRAVGEQVDLRMVLADGNMLAMVDPPELENALLNLSVNARDAMPGGGLLFIETAEVELDDHNIADHEGIGAGRYVVISVSDTGTGMDEETRLQAFDPFFTTKDVGKGSGLGLSMVYGFVKQSKGHVRLYSEPGHGTTVKLYLPSATAAKAPGGAGQALPARQKGSGRILVVEDDALVRKQVITQLVSFGYDVESAADGHEAIEILGRSTHFDLLFTDIIMPNGISGHQLAARARQMRPSLRVLFTSGYTNSTISKPGTQIDRTNLLTKPYRSKDLLEKVRNALQGRGD